MKVVKWDGGLAVRLPDEVVQLLGLKEGDEVDVEAAGEHTLRIERDRARQAALDRLKALSRPFPPDYRFDRDEANERGGRE
jgi:antitoxin MazE